MEGIIYKYVSPSGKVYIGQTVNEKHRRVIFLNLDCTYGGVKINNARKKCGPENFEYTVLMRVTGDNPEELMSYLNKLEIGFIRMYDSYKNGYNSTEGGQGVVGHIVSDETREKMSRSHTGKKRSNESKQKQSKSRKGKKITDEHKKKISESRKGMKFTDEHKKNMGKSRVGKKLTNEHKIKIGEALKGKIPYHMTDETREKLRRCHLGKVDSEETKRKKSESAKAGWEKRRTHK